MKAFKQNKIAIKKTILRRTRIQVRFMLSFLALSLIPLLCIGLLAITMSGNAVEDKIESYSSELLKRTGDYVDLKTAQILEVNKEVILSDLIQKDLPILDDMADLQRSQTAQSIERYMTNKFIKDKHVICSIILADKDKSFKYGPTGILPVDEWDRIRSLMREQSNGDREIKTLCLGLKLESQNAVVYAHNITSALTGEEIGVMITLVDEKYLSETYKEVQIAQDSDVFIIDNEGKMISGIDEQGLGQKIADGLFVEKIRESVQANQSFHYENTLVSSRLLNPSGWYLVSQIPYSYLYRESQSIRNFVIAFIVLSFVMSLATAWLITGSITSPLNKLVDAMNKAKEGDLTLGFSDDNRDELAELFKSFNQMLANIKQLVMRVRNAASQVIEGAAEVSVSAGQSFGFSQQIAAAVQQIAKGSASQASNTVESVHHMGYLSYDILHVGEIMNEVSESLDKTKSMSREIQGHIGNLNEKALETSEITQKVVGDIAELNACMQEIGKITKMIETVAEQTNLLSLNAAIEAARAGEAGRGFAVVAGEVKKLSDQSRDASQAIGALLKNIQSKTQATAVQAEDSLKIINDQTVAVSNANQSFKDIFITLEDNIVQMQRMNQCVDKMMVSKDKASEAMESVSSVSEEFAATAQEVSASTEEQIVSSGKLSELAKRISELANGLENAILEFKME